MVVGVFAVCAAADWSFLLGEAPEMKNDVSCEKSYKRKNS